MLRVGIYGATDIRGTYWSGFCPTIRIRRSVSDIGKLGR